MKFEIIESTYKCISQTETLDDWLGPWISFLWLMFLLASAFSIRILYKTYIKFRDTLAYKKDDGDYEFRDDISYETSRHRLTNQKIIVPYNSY